MKRLITHGLALVLVVGLAATPVAGAAAAPADWRPRVPKEKSVDGKDFVPRARIADPQAAHVLRTPPQVSWPATASDFVKAPADTEIKLLKSEGLVFSAKRDNRAATALEVDYSKFRNA